MHPVIRISLFFVFAYFLIQGKPGHIYLAGFILLGLSIFANCIEIRLIWKMVYSLKWFYVSIFALFYFFTPNDINQVENILSEFIHPGLYLALNKVVSLMLIVISVVVFIVSIPKPELLSNLSCA